MHSSLIRLSCDIKAFNYGQIIGFALFSVNSQLNPYSGYIDFTKIPSFDIISPLLIVYYAVVAQLVERIHGKDEVRGSNPRDGSIRVGTEVVKRGRL